MRLSETAGEQPAERNALLPLPADLGIEHAAALHELLAAHVADAGELVVDAAGVSRLHAAGLQLLCLFCRERWNAGLPTRWSAPSAALRAAAATLGMTDLLNLPPEQAA